MATQYANTELGLDAMATSIGVSRTKINDILKSELGFTFTGYLNKLRLTEAARLLAQEEEANIAEIAYSWATKMYPTLINYLKKNTAVPPRPSKPCAIKPTVPRQPDEKIQLKEKKLQLFAN